MRIKKDTKSANLGMTLILVLVFASIFTMSVMSMMSLTLTQARAGQSKVIKEQSLTIAEAGLEYYRWFLAHNPNDIYDGTGAPGTYIHSLNDPEGGELGSFSLNINANSKCGAIQSIDIASTGQSAKDTRYERTVRARYMRPSVAKYAYIINGNVWAGADRDIVGPYHSNGGIRMDGSNNSIVTSAVNSWLCTPSFGCNPSQSKPGVWGTGSNSSLWKYPAPQIDFAGITVDLANLKLMAQNQGGIYLEQITGGSDKSGYHLKFRADGYVEVYKVSKTQYAYSIHIDNISGGWQRDYHTILQEEWADTIHIDQGCPVIFVEDKLWIDGVIPGKITVVSADLQNPNNKTDIIINGNITYAHSNGSDGLTAIAQNSILIPVNSPDNLSLRGIFIAQNGYFGRNLYPCWYSPNDKKTNLSIQGTIVSNKRVGTKWGYSTWGCWGQWSGYNKRENSYDEYLATDPPPATPSTSDDYQFVRWSEDN